jgi:MipA family protein
MQTRRFSRLPIFLAALVCFGFIFSPAVLLAADVKISAGAGLAMVPDYEGSDDMTAAPALLFNATWDSGQFIKLAGPVLRGNVLPNKTWSMGPVLQYRQKRDDDVDSNAVAAMREVDAAVEGGAFVGYKNAGWDVSLKYVMDLSDTHEGSIGKLKGGYTFRNGSFTTRVGASASYADEDYMDTYFSVDTDNAGRSGLTEYTADAGIKDAGVDVMVNYSINDKWGVTGLAGFKKLLEDAENSPVVDDVGESSQMSVAFLLVYKF